MSQDQLAALARKVIETNAYMVLGTADENGLPWVTPVYYAAEELTRFFWVSSPDARHSQNVARRPEVSVVIFDSRVAIGEAEAVYMSARAEELEGQELEDGIDVFSRESLADGAREWSLDDVRPPARLRLYRATASEQFVLIPGRHPELGSGIDRREPVMLA